MKTAVTKIIRALGLLSITLAATHCGVAPRNYGPGITTTSSSNAVTISSNGATGSVVQNFSSLVIDSQTYAADIQSMMSGYTTIELSASSMPDQLAAFQATGQATLQIAGELTGSEAILELNTSAQQISQDGLDQYSAVLIQTSPGTYVLLGSAPAGMDGVASKVLSDLVAIHITVGASPF